jgi:hypothetical protein
MVLRLDPEWPLLWRSPSSVQFGSDDPAVVLSEVSAGEERLIAAVAAGVSESGFAMLAESLEVSPQRSQGLLDALAPVLVREPETSPPQVAAVLGDSPLARAIAGLLSASGALGSLDNAAVVVLVADWMIAPADHLPWLNRDVPHLPVVVAERAVTVGPLVDPGVGPCLHCVHRARVDDDPAWVAVATQLLGREPRALGSLELTETAAFATRRVLHRLAGRTEVGMSWRLGSDGAVTAREWRRHPDCRCAAPEGTDWAAAPDRADRDVPTRGPAVGALA